MNTSKFVIVLTSLVVMALLVGAVFLPTVSSSTTRTITTIEENDEPGWLKFGYSTTDNYNFNVEIDGDNLNVGGQTGELYDMMVLSTDALSIVVDEDTLVAITPNGAVDLGTTATVVKTSGGLNVNGTTYPAPLWSYYPKMNGNYAYFDHADLLTDNNPLSAWGKFAGVYAYRGIDSVGIGLTFSATITDGVIEGAMWTGSPSEDIEIPDEPFNPGSLNPLDPSIIDIDPFNPDEPGADVQNVDPTDGTRVGDLYYTFENNEASIVGYSSSIDWNTFTSIPTTVEYSGVTYTVTKIEDNAFKNCTNLALTSLPSTITYIDYSAFRGCTNLALTSLPSGITYLGLSVFYGCTNLALTSLPSGLTQINNGAFQNCTNLALTSLPDGVTSIGGSTFYNCPNLALTSLPSGLTSLSTSSFENCTNLALTSLPDGITSIPSTAFKGCTSLALTSLPDGVISIDTNAFMGCTNLALTSLPDGVISIGTNAFSRCPGMTSFVIPDTVTSVGDGAFSQCTGLKTVVIEGDTSFAGNVYYGVSAGLIVLGEPAFDAHTFDNTNITEVLNFGTSEITTTAAGLNADEVRTDIEALGYVAPLSITHIERVPIESPTTDVINILPLVAGVGLLLVALGVLIYRRT